MRYLSIILLLVSLAGVAAADSTSFGFDGTASSYTAMDTGFVGINWLDSWTWTGPSLVVDSGAVKLRAAMDSTWMKMAIWKNPERNDALAACSLVYETDTLTSTGFPSPEWNYFTDWSGADTLHSGYTYRVGVRGWTRAGNGGFQYKHSPYYASGSAGDGYVDTVAVGATITTAASFSSVSFRYAFIVWAHTADKDTVIFLDANTADSIGWRDTRLYQSGSEAAGGYGEWGICGDDAENEQQIMIFAHDSLTAWMPDDRVVDSAWIRTFFLASGRTHTDTIHPNARYLLRDWDEDTTCWTLYDEGASWTYGGAAGTGTDCADRVENADTVVRNAYGTWSDEIDTTGLSDSHDSADWWLSPVTLDSMNGGDLSNYGWRIGPDTVNNGQDKLGMRWHSRDYTSNPQYRPRIYIFMSEAEGEPEPPASGPIKARHSPDGSGVRHSPDGSSERHKP